MLACGAGLPLGVLSSLVVLSKDDSTEMAGTVTLLLAGVGASVGLTIGAVHRAVSKDGRLIYVASPSSAIRIHPIVTRGQQGVQMALAW